MYFFINKDSGNYFYYRRIPQKVQNLWGKKVEKHSLKTKVKSEANKKAIVSNRAYEEKLALYTKLVSGEKLPNREVMEHAKEILIKEGIHPQQVPNNRKEAMRFFDKVDEYKELWLSILPGVTEHNSPSTTGKGWDVEYEIDHNNSYYQTYNILEGEETLNIHPTLKEVTEGYINDGIGKRTEWNEKKHQEKTWRAIKALAPLDTPIN